MQESFHFKLKSLWSEAPVSSRISSLRFQLYITFEAAPRIKPVQSNTRTKVKEEEIEPNFSDELEGTDREDDEEGETKSISSLSYLFELTTIQYPT
jgi:hypothetical protein